MFRMSMGCRAATAVARLDLGRLSLSGARRTILGTMGLLQLSLQLMIFCVVWLLICTPAFAATHYVDAKSTTPASPYSDWSTAATNIQDAINVAAAGDDIVVTNGTYAPFSVNEPLVLHSVNGPATTVIDGGGTVSCAYLTNGASLLGFTLTHGSGYTYAGGAWGSAASAFASNCVITGNARGGASGLSLESCLISNNSSGGVFSSVLNSCTIVGNESFFEGGGAASCQLTNCLILSNAVPFDVECRSYKYGGGAYNCTLDHCTLIGNLVGNYGGGAYGSILTHCVLQSNVVSGGCIKAGGGAFQSTLSDCLVIGNSAQLSLSAGGGAGACTLSNCTLMWNTADYEGGEHCMPV